MKKAQHVILGAGISGLALAWCLLKKDPSTDIVILEKSHRTGGWIKSRSVGDFFFECGPRSCRTKGNGFYTLKLIEELGIQDKVIFADPSAKKRYLYENGKLRALPTSLISCLASPFLPLILKAFLKDLFHKKTINEDESIFNFALRHFGKELAERFIDPLTIGIYAGDCRNLSVGACFPSWVKTEQAYGSFIKDAVFHRSKLPHASSWIQTIQKEPIFSLQGGMEQLVSTLAIQLKDQIFLDHEVINIHLHPNSTELTLKNGTTLSADRVYSTLPGPALSKLLKDRDLNIPHTDVAIASIGFNDHVLKYKGFGFLVSSIQQSEILGMVWDSVVFPAQNKQSNETRLTVMIKAEEIKDFHQIALDSLIQYLHIEKEPDILEIEIAKQCIPKYEIGHLKKVASLRKKYEETYPHFSLLGTSFDGVSVNDCIARAYSFRS